MCHEEKKSHDKKSCEYIILHHDELYIASSTLQEIIHICKGDIQNQDQSTCLSSI